MKIINSLFLGFLLVSCSRFNQASNLPTNEKIDKNPQVCVKDWGKMKMMIGDEIWNNAENEIVSQIGVDEYAIVKKSYDYRSIPSAMSLSNAENRKNVSKFYQKLSMLKLYKVATFTNLSGGKNWGKSAILKVPYDGNQEWDKNVKWDSVYFIINEDAIEVK